MQARSGNQPPKGRTPRGPRLYDGIDPLGSDEVRRALAFARARERYAGTRRDDLLSCCEAAWEAAVTSGADGDPIDRFDRSLKLIAWTRGWTRGPVDLSDLRGQAIPMSVLRPFMLPGSARESLERAAGPPRPLPAHARSSRPRFPRLPFLSPVPMASALAAGMIGIAVMGQSGSLPSLSIDPSGAKADDDGAPGSGAAPVDGVQTGPTGSGPAADGGSSGGGAWRIADGEGPHVAGVASAMPGVSARSGSTGSHGGGPMPAIALSPPASKAPPVSGGAPATPIRTVGPATPRPPAPAPTVTRPVPQLPAVKVPDLVDVARPDPGPSEQAPAADDQQPSDEHPLGFGQGEDQTPTESLQQYLDQLRQNLAEHPPVTAPVQTPVSTPTPEPQPPAQQEPAGQQQPADEQQRPAADQKPPAQQTPPAPTPPAPPKAAPAATPKPAADPASVPAAPTPPAKQQASATQAPTAPVAPAAPTPPPPPAGA